MDEIILVILAELEERSSKNQDGWVPCLDVGVLGEERDYICNYLCKNGLVNEIEKIGQTKITCRVTQKLRDLFKER